MLLSKLNKPPITSNQVIRSRLIKIIEQASHLPLILVVAPAGYGKSITVSQWLGQTTTSYCWISLDDRLNNLPTFLNYLVEAVQQTLPGSLNQLEQLVQTAHLLSAQAVAEQVSNVLHSIPAKLVLVLDDYHYIHDSSIHTLVNTLLEHPSEHLQLVLITRRDPPLNIQRLKLHKQLLNIRMSDLAFSFKELEDFFDRNQPLDLNSYDLHDILNWSEGWPLGIKMFVTTELLSGKILASRRSDTLSHDIHFLVEQLTDNLPADFTQLLFLTACCNRFNADLLDELFQFHQLHTMSAEEFIERLKVQNLFIVPLDTEDHWYRFHHLFRDLLRRRWFRKGRDYHQSSLFVSTWFSENGLLEDAIECATNFGHFETAADLITYYRFDKSYHGQWWKVQHWLELLPEGVKKSNARLLLAQLWVNEFSWDLKANSLILSLLEGPVKPNYSPQTKAEYLYHQAHHLLFSQSNPGEARILLLKAKSLYFDDFMFGARIEITLAFSRQMLGMADEALEELDLIEKSYKPQELMYLRALLSRIFVLLLSGNFQESINVAELFSFLAKDCDFRAVRVWSYYMHGNVAFQQWETDQAQIYLPQALAAYGQLNTRALFDAFAAFVILQALQGDFDGAWSTLDLMKHRINQMKSQQFSAVVQSTEMRLRWLAHDQSVDLLQWSKDSSLAKQKPVDVFMAVEHSELTKIRILVTLGSNTEILEGVQRMDRISQLALLANNQYYRVDLLLLNAVACFRMNEPEKSRELLRESLQLSVAQGILRPFVEISSVVPDLFWLVDKSEIPVSLWHLVKVRPADSGAVNISPEKTNNQLSPLTIREQQIVRLTAEGLRNKEIGERLNISVVTVKSHLTHIFQKLDVPNRTKMINKARTLQILS